MSRRIACGSPTRGCLCSETGSLGARLETLRTRKATETDLRALAGAFSALALEAHFKDVGGGAISLMAWAEALDLWRSVGDRDQEAGTLAGRAETLALLGKLDAAESDLLTCVGLRDAGHGVVLARAEAYCRLGELRTKMGRFDDARRALDISLTLRQNAVEPAGIADCLQALGILALAEHQCGLARQCLTDAVHRNAQLGRRESWAAALGDLGDVALAEGKLDEAGRLFGDGLSVWEPLDQNFWIGRFETRLAALALRRGELDLARRQVQSALTRLERSNGPVAQALPLMVMGDIARARADRVSAELCYRRALTLRESAGLTPAIDETRRALASLPAR